MFAGINGEPSLYTTDVTGNYLQYKANSIGESDSKIKEKLKEKYTENLTTKEGITLALEIFKEVQGEDYNINKFDAGILEKGKPFQKLSGKELE